ncbi:MAG: HxlR family transcriptional regulator [Devosia sp.]|nr:HxlR family transcriptional regulator [Devosia sp.]
MQTQGYQQFCPVAMACEMLEPRWTMLILCEIWSGSTRFSDIQRGVPGMSPSLLSKRLKDMAMQGLLTRAIRADKHTDYRTTPMANELEPLVHELGAWAHRHVDPTLQLKCLDDHLLMWNIRRKIQVTDQFRRKAIIQFILKVSGKSDRNYWLIVRPNGDTDLCMIDPKFEVDLYVSADLKALTSAWMGHSSFAEEIAQETIVMIGDEGLSRSLPRWLKRSSFAGDEVLTDTMDATRC